jgi:hypothetical protein
MIIKRWYLFILLPAIIGTPIELYISFFIVDDNIPLMILTFIPMILLYSNLTVYYRGFINGAREV